MRPLHNFRFILLGLGAWWAPVAAATYPPGFIEQVVSDDLISPSGLAVAADGRVFFGEQKGKIRVVIADSLPPALLIDLQAKTDYNTERGLMGIALDTGFADSGFLYVYYTARDPYSHNRLSRFTVTQDSTGATLADTAETVLFALPELPPRSRFNSQNVPGITEQAVWHMGGGPVVGLDGKLYVGVGEHEVPAYAQDLSSLFGKVLRLNPDGSIPEDNPFYQELDDSLRAIYAYGFRNPYTLAVQPGAGRIFANDVGGGSYEEVDTLTAGGNYGWSDCEGPFCNVTDAVAPLYAYGRNGASGGNCVVGGGFSTRVFVPADTTAALDTTYTTDTVDMTDTAGSPAASTDSATVDSAAAAADTARAVPGFRAADSGRYFFADFVNGRSNASWIRSVDPADGSDVELFAEDLSNVTGLAFGPDGALYVMERGYSTGPIDTLPGTRRGRLLRIEYTGAVADTGDTVVTALRRAREAPRAASGLMVSLRGRTLAVPPGRTEIAVYALSGARVWEARGLRSGARVTLPGTLPEGVLRVVWGP